MMFKTKLYATILVIYEILAVMLLHCPRACDAVFCGMFCNDTVYKYFIVCFAFPAIVFLILMWVMHIINAIRRRHSVFYRAKQAVHDVADNIRHDVGNSISREDIEKYITAALIAGAQRYIVKHPEVKQKLSRFMDKMGAGYAEMVEDTEDDDDMMEKQMRTRRSTTARSGKSGQKKKR